MYKIIRFKRYYLIANTKGEYKNHTHIKIRSKKASKEYKTCLLIVNLVTHKLLPRSPFLSLSCMRLTLDEEYKKALEENLIRKKKNKYINRR